MNATSQSPAGGAGRSQHYRRLFWPTLGRMILLYFVPLLLLGVFFRVQYRLLVRDSTRAHLEVIAEHQANTFDLFLRERVVNLVHIVDDPSVVLRSADDSQLRLQLNRLRSTSDAFVDLGVVAANGDLQGYAGPVDFTDRVNYSGEAWFQALLAAPNGSLITEIYRGIRDMPHFTIAVKRERRAGTEILRAALSPEKLSEFLTTLEGASEVHAAVVNQAGVLQVTTPRAGDPLRASSFLPPVQPSRGYVAPGRRGSTPGYAYAWLSETPWALVVTSAGPEEEIATVGLSGNVFLVAIGILTVAGAIVLFRARQVVGAQIAVERHEQELSGQLVHAARLASVGELAAGIAHEINNPLAIIAEEVGVLKDSTDPALISETDEPLDVNEHLAAIHDAVFRCRDITRKLLMFVRDAEVRVEPHHVHSIVDDVLEGILGNELAISNVEVERRYDDRIPEFLTDRNQLIQVFVNLVKNALDAMPEGGHLTVITRHLDDRASVTVADTGCGMTPQQLGRVFAPFFTTKDPGKGTGLGLSVSYSIIKGFGGACYVESTPGQGSSFTVELPYEIP